MNVNTSIAKDVLEEYYVGQKTSAHKIAKLLNLKPHQVYYLLEKNGISRRPLTQMDTTFSVNHDYFSTIDSAEKAYWLGFLYADGFVSNRHQIGLSLAKQDILHVEKFKKSVQSSHPIHIYKEGGYGKGEYAKIIFSSEKMAEDLKRLGCVQRKSLVLEFPSNEQVPPEYLRDFVRGYIDGEGSITTGGRWHPIRLKVCGTKAFLSALLDYFNEIVKPESFSVSLEKRRQDDKDNYSITVGSTKRVLTILDMLYENSDIYLERKYALYIEKKNALQLSSLSEMVGV